MDEYPLFSINSHPCWFQAYWSKRFPRLEYSPEVEAEFCLPCYLFSIKSSSFTSGEFRNWEKVNNMKDCSFLSHMGKTPKSPYSVAIKYCEDLKNQSSHIENY